MFNSKSSQMAPSFLHMTNARNFDLRAGCRFLVPPLEVRNIPPKLQLAALRWDIDDFAYPASLHPFVRPLLPSEAK